MTDQVKNYDGLMAEIEKRAFRFEFAGREWHVRANHDVNYRLIRDAALSGSDLDAVDAIFRNGMGPEQWADWEAVPDIPASVLRAIFDDYLEFCGTSRGKSPDSTDSSESTERRSKPASKRPTKSASRASGTGRSRSAGSSLS